MAKLVSITQKALASLLTKAKKSGALALVEQIGRSVDMSPRGRAGFRSSITSVAQKEANSRGRVLLTKNDFKNLARAAGLQRNGGGFVQGMAEARSAHGEIRVTRGKSPAPNVRESFKTRGVSKRGRIESRESQLYQRSDGTFGATSGGSRRTEGTRELDERELRSRRIQERKAAAEGKKLNRTMKVTRRDLEEDTF